MIGIPIGLAAANVTEWLLHKHLLHGQGRKKGTMWSFHWHEHHAAARRNNMFDPDYTRSPFGWNAQGKELLALTALMLPISLLAPVAPFFVATTLYTTVRYYRIHKKAHLDAAWCREHLPWHYDHHMGPDQDANWCVTKPWFDIIVGTRKVYAGTPKEGADWKRRSEKMERAKAAAIEWRSPAEGFPEKAVAEKIVA